MPKRTAQTYLDTHGGYVEALQALLADLEAAKNSRRAEQEQMLCDAIDELRIICGNADPSARWSWPVPNRQATTG